MNELFICKRFFPKKKQQKNSHYRSKYCYKNLPAKKKISGIKVGNFQKTFFFEQKKHFSNNYPPKGKGKQTKIQREKSV